MKDEKFNERDLKMAMEELSVCKFFPADPGGRAVIMRLLAHMCPHKQALRWLSSTMVNSIGEWHGPKELRGLLCTRFKPADGIEAECSIPGFRPEDSEMACIEEHNRLLSGEPQKLLTGTVDPESEKAYEATMREIAQIIERSSAAMGERRRKELDRVEKEIKTAPKVWLSEEEKQRRLEELRKLTGRVN